MRIPFPERVPFGQVAVFAVVLFIIQSIEGTPVYFSAGCAAFILLAAFAFNTAGGLTRASGAYVFFYSVLVVIIGVAYKALLGEPAQSNLQDPRTTIAVYVGGMAAMLAAVVVSRRFSRKSGLLQNVLPESRMYRASVGCMLFGIIGGSVIHLLGNSADRLASAFTQLNQLIPLGIIIGVMYEIRRSGGTRSVNLPILFAIGYCFFYYGVVGFSKQGMLLPLVCWIFPVCAMRFRLSAMQMFGCLAGVAVVFLYLVPFAQYGRRFIDDSQTFSQRVEVAVRLLEHPEETRKHYEESTPGGGLNDYYNTPQGFWDRLQFVSVDDKLIAFTDQGKVFGLSPLKYAIFGIVPHVFWPDKPEFNPGYTYALELSGQTPDPNGPQVGISFSPTAEAYHMAGWVGVLIVAPLLWFLLFIVYDSMFGDLRATPWGLLVIALFSHSAPEGALSGVIHSLSFDLEALLFCAFFAAWVAPVLAIGILGPDRRIQAGPPPFQPAWTPRIPR